MSKWWVACIGEEADSPMGSFDTLEKAIEHADTLFASATPRTTPFAFWVYNPEEKGVRYMTEEVMPTTPQHD